MTAAAIAIWAAVKDLSGPVITALGIVVFAGMSVILTLAIHLARLRFFQSAIWKTILAVLLLAGLLVVGNQVQAIYSEVRDLRANANKPPERIIESPNPGLQRDVTALTIKVSDQQTQITRLTQERDTCRRERDNSARLRVLRRQMGQHSTAGLTLVSQCGDVPPQQYAGIVNAWQVKGVSMLTAAGLDDAARRFDKLVYPTGGYRVSYPDCRQFNADNRDVAVKVRQRLVIWEDISAGLQK